METSDNLNLNSEDYNELRYLKDEINIFLDYLVDNYDSLNDSVMDENIENIEAIIKKMLDIVLPDGNQEEEQLLETKIVAHTKTTEIVTAHKKIKKIRFEEI